jgi:adenosylcobinamide-phosphate guanylyltransferase
MKQLNALVMAGGKGGRLGSKGEKPLVSFRGKPIIEYVLDALRGSRYIERVIVATSGHTKNTKKFLDSKSIETIETEGKDYVEDLVYAVERLRLGRTLVVSSDLPLITSREIDFVVREYLDQTCPAMAVMAPLRVFERYGIEPSLAMGDLVPVGLNIVDGRDLNGEERVLVVEKPEFAFNVNTLEDLKRIERFKMGKNDVV